MARFVRLAGLSLLLMPSLATAQQTPRHERASSWTTTIVPAANAKARNIATGSLPPDAGPKTLPSIAKGSHDLNGLASYYWQEQKTASGERFDKTAMTAAHRTLPFNTKVKVTHLGNGRTVIVRINDRGPFKPGRVIDLSYAAAGALDMHKHGLAKVKLEVVDASAP